MSKKIIIKRINVLPAKPCLAEVLELLKRQEILMENLMATVAELGGRLTAVLEKLNKAQAEIVAQIEILRASLDSAGVLPEDAALALDNLEIIAQALDDINPDVEVV